MVEAEGQVDRDGDSVVVGVLVGHIVGTGRRVCVPVPFIVREVRGEGVPVAGRGVPVPPPRPVPDTKGDRLGMGVRD